MPKSFKQIKEEFVGDTRIAGVKTNNPVILAMIGLTGTGISTISRTFHKLLGWPVIEKNKIRVVLRQRGRGFTSIKTDIIQYAAIGKVLKAGGNMILDSDFIEKGKRKKLGRFARRFNARVLYLRVLCDRDVMIERILRARYNPKTDIFTSAVIALREHCRRYPWHYRWSEAGGGTYTLKHPPIKFLAEIDTTRPAVWKKKLRFAAKQIRRI